MAFSTFIYDARATVAGVRLYRRAWGAHTRWSTDECTAYQFDKLRTLLIDAASHVPYYRELFARIGFDPHADFRELADLTALPILTKSDIRRHAGALQRSPRPRRSICERTSGSTGEPLAVWISPAQIAVEKATVWRHWRGLGYRFRDPVAIVRTYVPRDGEPLWRYDRLRNFLFLSAYHLDRHNATIFLQRLLRFRPKFLRGYPTSLAILADAAHDHGVHMQGIRAILTASETLTVDTRSHLTQTFDAPVSDWYGLAEQVISAAQCHAGEGMHCHDDYGFWELVPLADGSGRSRIIGTNLHNTAMPLIRYDTGDLTTGLIDQPCPCGNTMPRIAGIAGRQDDELIGSDGRRIPAVSFYSVFRDFPTVRRFQMIQRRPTEIEVRLDADAFDLTQRRILLRALAERLGRGMSIRIIRGKSFERSPQGKRRTVISHVRNRLRQTEKDS